MNDIFAHDALNANRLRALDPDHARKAAQRDLAALQAKRPWTRRDADRALFLLALAEDNQ